MSTSVRVLLLAGAFLPAIASFGVHAETLSGAQPARFVCNADGRCYETGDLERRDVDRRPPPPRGDDRHPDYRRDFRDDDDD